LKKKLPIIYFAEKRFKEIYEKLFIEIFTGVICQKHYVSDHTEMLCISVASHFSVKILIQRNA